jgi:hypothetical protein
MKVMRASLCLTAGALSALALAPAASAQAPRQADAPASQLERADRTELPGGAIATRFEQQVGGVPVAGAGAVVIDAAGEAPDLVADETVEGLSHPGAPSLSRSEAVGRALSAIGDPVGGDVKARLVIDATRGNQLVWRVTHSDGRPLSDWLVSVSDATGEVLATQDLLLDATGQARLFVPNPVVANDGYSKLEDRDDRNSAKLTDLREPVALELLKDGQSCLKGTYASVRLGDKEKRVCRGSLNWRSVRRAQDRFEALMTYHHITAVQQHFQSLEIDDANAERQDAVADATMPPGLGQDNSFYSPSRDEIRFGRGGVDDAEDGDVIAHEYGHAVQFAQNFDAFVTGTQAGAMGEGFGDYLAAAYSTERAGFDSEWTPCIMDWDATAYDFSPSNGICLRRADDPSNRNQQTGQCEGGAQNIHCVGQVWSSALLDLRNELGDELGGDSIMDTLVLASHELIAGQATFEKGAQAIIDADDDIYSGVHCVALANEFEDRGFGQFAAAC